MSWCLRAKGYGWAAIGAAFGFVAVYIITAFYIIALYLWSTLYSSILVSFKFLVSLSSTCLCIWALPGIKIEVLGTGFELLEVLHWFYEELSGCIHCASTWSESMEYVTSLTTNGLRGSLMLLSGFISPRWQFLGRIISSKLVLIIVHSRNTGNFSLISWVLAQQRDVVVTYVGLMVPWSYNDSQVWVYY